MLNCSGSGLMVNTMFGFANFIAKVGFTNGSCTLFGQTTTLYPHAYLSWHAIMR